MAPQKLPNPELEAATKRIAELEERIRTAPAGEAQPRPPQNSIEALRARAEACLAARNGTELFSLIRELSGLGPDAYPGIAALLAAAEELGWSALGMPPGDYMDAYNFLHPAFLRWCLEEPDGAETFVRQMAAAGFAEATGKSAGPQLLAWLGKEKDPEVAWMLALQLRSRTTPGMADDLAAVVRAHPGAENVVDMAIEVLAGLGDARADELLVSFGADSNPVIREAAQMEILARNPPVAGVLVESLVTDESQVRSPLLRGDIITSMDGRAPLSGAEVTKRLRDLPEGAAVSVLVRRGTQDLNFQIGHNMSLTFVRDVKPR